VVAVFLRELIEGAGKFREIGDRGTVVAAHTKKRGGFLSGRADDRGFHVENGGGARGIRADACTSHLVTKVGNVSKADVNLGSGNGEPSLTKSGIGNVEVTDVVGEVGRRSLGEKVINVG